MEDYAYLVLSFISESLFRGLPFLLAFLLILKILKSKLLLFRQELAVEAASLLLLMAGSFTLLLYGSELFTAWYSGVGYEQYTIIGGTQAYLWITLLMYFTLFALLPQLMWIPKLRKSLVAGLLIITLQYVAPLLVATFLSAPRRYFSYEPSLIEWAGKAAVFTIAFLMVYLLLIYRHQKAYSS